MKTVYVVQWVMEDCGQTNDSCMLYLNLEECHKDTREASFHGAFSEGNHVWYYGPQRPLGFYEASVENLCEGDRILVEKYNKFRIPNSRLPALNGGFHYLDE